MPNWFAVTLADAECRSFSLCTLHFALRTWMMVPEVGIAPTSQRLQRCANLSQLFGGSWRTATIGGLQLLAVGHEFVAIYAAQIWLAEP